MLVSSRRSLILGVTSLVAAPSIVRATSLMELSGFELDPRVVAFCVAAFCRGGIYGRNWAASAVNEFPWSKQKALRTIKWVFPGNTYDIVRTSELGPYVHTHLPTKVLIEKCLRTHTSAISQET